MFYTANRACGGLTSTVMSLFSVEGMQGGSVVVLLTPEGEGGDEGGGMGLSANAVVGKLGAGVGRSSSEVVDEDVLGTKTPGLNI